MRAKEFLLEYDRSREQQRIESLPAYQNRLKEDPEFSLEKLESADPTVQKTYVPRLATWWMRGAKIEDLISRGADNLEKFAQLKQKNLLKPEHKDINSFKEFIDFEITMDVYQLYGPKKQEKQDRGKYKEIYRDSELLVVQLFNKPAAQFWGQSTRWCTAAKKNNMFHLYAKRGPLFVIIPRNDPTHKYQYWFDNKDPYDMQFMDVQDKDFNPRDSAFFSKLQKIMHPISSHIMWNPNPTEEEQIKGVQQDVDELLYIKNPSEAVQMAAVKRSSHAIQYIKHPSEEIKLAAVKKNGFTLQYIKHPSEELQLAAVAQEGYAIHYIKNPSEEIQFAAVKQNGHAIQYIKNPSEELQFAAVKQNSSAIKSIDNPSEDVQIAAVKRNGFVIYYINNPSEAVQLAAVTQNKDSIHHIENPTPKVKALANK